MKYVLTKHAEKVLAEREIPLAWLERTLNEPEIRRPDPNDSTLERRFCRIHEFGGRFLRVVVNISVDPIRVVSVYFDRTMKDAL